MQNLKTMRLQLSFDVEWESDLCAYLSTYRKSDRHGLIAHALRVLIHAEGFTPSEKKFSNKKKAQTATPDANSELDMMEIEDMSAIGKTF
jgi:hypothetical protein